MDSATSLDVARPAQTTEKTFSTDLISVFEAQADKIKILSLDCFDTLLWRKTATPIDVFYDIQNRPAFQALGFTALMRARSEQIARRVHWVKQGHGEVNLNDIYRATFLHLTDEQSKALAEDELSAEIAACYAFPHVVNLIRKAHEKKLKIIIVSDTYFTQPQLQHLLSQHLPNDVMAMIDTIFCSSEYGRSKVNGLFKHVLTTLQCAPELILHIGDNALADLQGPREQRVNTLQLLHHGETGTELLRMQALAAALFDPQVRYTRGLSSPFRGMLAAANFASAQPEQVIGYTSIGPIMYSFAQYILHEVENLTQAGKRPKILFLMRDAYLPMLTCKAIAGHSIGYPIRISRFASYAASFRSVEDVDRYLAGLIHTNRFIDMGRQLLLPDEMLRPIVQLVIAAENPAREFINLVHREDVLNIIFKLSAEYCRRLCKYLQKETQLQAGDTLVFVDLGYSGTAQRQLAPVLKEEMNVDIEGRYLISLDVPDSREARAGLLDPTWCDDKAMRTLVTYIAVLEQICTSSEGSVTNYDSQGNPIFTDASFKEQQYEKLEKIQTECTRFARDAKLFFDNMKGQPSIQILRESALAELARFIYFSTEKEIEYLKTFQFDVNLGTKDTYSLFDIEKGLAGLRRRGLFSCFMEKNTQSFRTNTPAELRTAGMELAISLVAHHRFGLELGIKDLSMRKEALNILIVSGQHVSQTTVEAQLTYDGYFSLLLPIGRGNFQLSILFGEKYKWIEFDSAELFDTNSYLSAVESKNTADCWSNLTFHDMSGKTQKLFECLANSSAVIFTPPQKIEQENSILRIVFRPIKN